MQYLVATGLVGMAAAAAAAVVRVMSSTRTVLIVLGVFSALLAHTTRINYTLDELPSRDVCVIALWATAIIGLGTAIVKPNPFTRGLVGMLVMVTAATRMAGFSIRTVRETDGVWGFVEGTNAVWVWAIVGYFGFLLWARRWDKPRGARDVR